MRKKIDVAIAILLEEITSSRNSSAILDITTAIRNLAEAGQIYEYAEARESEEAQKAVEGFFGEEALL